MSGGTRLRRLRAIARDERGAIGPMVAVLSVSLLLATGLALDVALYYSGNRELRSATEAAALAAATRASSASAARDRAEQYLRQNGYDASVIKSFQVGYYCANDADKAANNSGSRFFLSPAAGGCAGSTRGTNAVRLTTGKTGKRFLTGVLGRAAPIPDLAATASAARVDEAGISITSGLLTITNTLVVAVNDLLGALLGIKLRLNTDDIEALMGGNVDAGRFFDALAKRTGKTGTYQQLTQGTYGMQDLALAAADAAYDSRTAAALRVFASQVSNGYQVPLTGLFGLGVWKNMPVGGADVAPSLRAGINAYQLIAYAAQAGPGAIDLSDLVSIVVPNSTVAIRAVATGHMDRPRFAFGPAGETTVGTSLLRLQVDVNLVNLNVVDLVNASARVPLVIDVAAADATIKTISCENNAEQRNTTSVKVETHTGLVNVYLGEPTRASMMTKPVPPISAADFDVADILKLRLNLLLIGLDVVSVQGKAVVQPVVGATRDVDFSAKAPSNPADDPLVALQKPISFGGGVVVGNQLQLGSTIQSLNTSLLAPGNLRACTLALICLSSDQRVISSVSSVLGTVGNVLGNTADPLLDNVLAALGIQLGHATVWTTGARCGVPVLI